MIRSDPMDFAGNWIDVWNRGDIAAAIDGLAVDATFESPRSGGVLTGRNTILAYWQEAVTADLEVTLESVLVAPGSVVVMYRKQTGEQRAEVFAFDGDGSIKSIVAHYGVM